MQTRWLTAGRNTFQMYRLGANRNRQVIANPTTYFSKCRYTIPSEMVLRQSDACRDRLMQTTSAAPHTDLRWFDSLVTGALYSIQYIHILRSSRTNAFRPCSSIAFRLIDLFTYYANSEFNDPMISRVCVCVCSHSLHCTLALTQHRVCSTIFALIAFRLFARFGVPCPNADPTKPSQANHYHMPIKYNKI